MPIYEYICEDCQTHFEKIVLNKTQEIACPKCAGKRNAIQLSVFSAANGSSWWVLLGSASVPTGAQFNRCVQGKKQHSTMLYLIYRKVLIVPTNTGMVTMPGIRVVMPLGTSLAISTWATTVGSTEVAGIIEFRSSRDQSWRS